MSESASDSLEDENDGSESLAKFQQLSENIRTFVAADILCEDWNFLRGRNDLLRIGMAPVEFVAALELQCGYTAEMLAELGLYERVDDELRLASWLEDDGDIYVTINEIDRAISFSGGNNSLFPMNRRALDYAVERLPADSTQAPVTLFVVESQDSVEVMQWLGLQSVSCKSLDALDCEGVSRMFSGDLRSDFGWRYYLLLLDCDLASLENRPQAAIQDVIDRLADAQLMYNVNPSRRFGVCRPTASEFASLKRAIAFKDSTQICQAFGNWSTAAKSVTIDSWQTYFAVEILSFSAAHAALTDALQHSSRFYRELAVRVALPAYRAAGHGVLMKKFYYAIDRANDPFDQVEIMAAASLAETFLDDDPLVRAAEAVLAGKTPPSARELREELFDQRQRCLAAIWRIRRDRKAKR